MHFQDSITMYNSGSVYLAVGMPRENPLFFRDDGLIIAELVYSRP